MIEAVKKAAATIAMALMSTVSSAAPIVNGRFEAGSLSGWNIFLPTGEFGAAVDAKFGASPIQGNYSALLVTNAHPVPCDFDPWSAACPSYPPIPFVSEVSGGAPVTYAFPTQTEFFLSGTPFVTGPFSTARLGQDINLHVGDHVQFDWTWFTNESGAFVSPEGDYLLAILRNESQIIGFQPKLYGGQNSAPLETGFRYMASFDPVDLLVPTSGLWTLYIEIGQSNDRIASSGILIDNVLVRKVPEPSTLAALAIGLAGLAFTRRRN